MLSMYVLVSMHAVAGGSETETETERGKAKFKLIGALSGCGGGVSWHELVQPCGRVIMVGQAAKVLINM